MIRFIVCLFVTITLFATVTESISPQFARLCEKENLAEDRYAPGQVQEIERALANHSIRVITYNILYNCFDEGVEKKHRWEKRKERVIEAIKEMDGDIIALQEVLPDQLEYFCSTFPAKYDTYFGLPRYNEHCPIFYNTTRFECLESSSIELAKNQNRLSMVKLKDRVSGAVLAVFNTHLAFLNKAAREKQAKVINCEISKWCLDCHVILMGDMNTFSALLDLKQLPVYDGDYIENILTGNDLKDARFKSLIGHLGPRSTFTNREGDIVSFKGTGTGTPGIYLDHIYVSNRLQVLLHGVNPLKVDGEFPSDHMPVMAELSI